MDYDWGGEDELLAEFHAAGILLPREIEELKHAAEMQRGMMNLGMQQSSYYAQQQFSQQLFLNQQQQAQQQYNALGGLRGLGSIGGLLGGLGLK